MILHHTCIKILQEYITSSFICLLISLLPQVEAGGAAHEAGYDAFMTGTVFAHLIWIIQAKDNASSGAAMPAEQMQGVGPSLPSELADLDLNLQNDDRAGLSATVASSLDTIVLLPVQRLKNRLNIVRAIVHKFSVSCPQSDAKQTMDM
jgi:hypothetical protein